MVINSQTNYTVVLEEAGDDLILPLPQELLAELNWHIGDTLQWTEQGEGSWSLKKKL